MELKFPGDFQYGISRSCWTSVNIRRGHYGRATRYYGDSCCRWLNDSDDDDDDDDEV